MTKATFRKVLSANDVGATGSHQAGILIPRGEAALLAFLPKLDASVKNPDCWLDCVDSQGNSLKFRYVYYNGKIHNDGTRNEYRITYMTQFFRAANAVEGDLFEISREENSRTYQVRVVRLGAEPVTQPAAGFRIKLKGWRQVH